MSFLMPSPRGFEQPPHPEMPDLSSHSQNGRIQMSSSSYDTYPPQPQPDPPSPSHSAPFVHDRAPITLPKVGQTRCYWSLLSSDLQFIYLDPVLSSHLDEQAEELVGKSLLAFVHPDEQASAKHDLGSVLESTTSHGSITRVRYSRLSRVRRELGYKGPGPPWTDAEKIALDSNYMAVDIVINWAAEGLVLCFIHATVDLTPDDNDEHHKTDWTNWCGTPNMTMEQIQLLYRRLLVCVPQPSTMSRVFQILSNRQGRPLLLSWPPDQGQGPGSDFAKLVENVQIGVDVPSENDAKTNCTRRYKASQNMPAVGGGTVESTLILYGALIFSCHKVDPPSRGTATTTATMQLGYNVANYNTQPSQPYYEPGSGSYALPPLAPPPASYNNYPPQQSQQTQQASTPYSSQRWAHGGEQPGSYNQWNASSPTHSISPVPPSVSNLRSGSYPPPQQTHQWQAQSSSYLDSNNSVPQGFHRSISPSYAYNSNAGGSEGASPSADVVPPPRRRVSPGSTRDQYGPGGRSAGNRPMGVLKCSSCKATQSPEWRKGPTGKKELCNACGLRYARSRAKKEGHSLTQRRRKDKGLAKRESATPPTSAPSSYSVIRRHHDDSSFMSTSSAGSGSGSDIYPHSGHRGLDDMTPSPSPPASSMSFVHYSPGGDSRQSYSSNSSTFYSVPSPLSNQPVLHSQHGNQPPRLDHIPSYTDRVSPMHSSGSPVSHSPLTSTVPPASFERERDRDRELRELPPTPVSAEPRHSSRRSILAQQ